MTRWRIGDETHQASARALAEGRFTVQLDDEEPIEVAARRDRDGTLVLTLPDGGTLRAAITRDADRRWVSIAGRTLVATEERGRRRRGAEHHGDLEAPMPGRIVSVAVAVGDAVDKGQTLITLEAMKMEHALRAPRDGIVRELRCEEGELVQPGVALVVLSEADG